MLPRISFSLIVAVALAFSPKVALASDSAAAETLFRSAREAAERGDWVTACDRFEESKRLEPAPGTVLNLARCREELGQVASAWKSYEEAAERLPSGDERADFARARARELEPRVPKVTLVAPETDTAFVVMVRGVEYSSATFGVPLPFDPGKLDIVVRAEGHEDSIFRTKIGEGENLTHRLEMGRLPTKGGRVVEDAVDAPSSRRTWGVVSLSIGGVGAIFAGVGAVLAAKELPAVRDNCNDDKECNRVGDDAARRGRTGVYLLGGGAALTLVGVGVGTMLLITPDPKTEVGFLPLSGGGILSMRRSL